MSPDDVPCGAITTSEEGEPQRCTRTPVDHRGPHWQEVEPLPPGCTCHTICHCMEVMA